MTVDIDIASILDAITWPLAVLVIFLLYRKHLPAIAEAVGRHVRKVEFAGVSIELAMAEPFAPSWSGAPSALDLRHRAAASQVSDSTARTFIDQLSERGRADYAEVNLGEGEEWLTSRLFIMSILFPRHRGVRAFVFLEAAGGVRRRYLGWASPDRLRWCLARRYPWLEAAYANAYAQLLERPDVAVADADGALRSTWGPGDAGPSVDLMRGFLERVQGVPAPAQDPDWVEIEGDPGTAPVVEHAHWLDGRLLEELLGAELHRASFTMDVLMSRPAPVQMRELAAMDGAFIGVTDAQQRFDALIDRHHTLAQAARACSAAS